jgi:lipoprotein-releasing system ATP-binding protein
VRTHLSPPLQPDAEHDAARGAPALRAVGIWKGYPTATGRLEVLKGVDLEVPRGTILAILGASGSGKSTLLNILGTLDRADQGRLELGGLALGGLSDARIAEVRSRRLGFVFQFHHLLPEFDAMENVMMPLLIAGVDDREAADRARAALTSVGLHQRWEHRPAELSGGEAQRVAVARALVSNPELVLADEPSGNLDPAAAEELHELLASLARERHQTFVIVTHNDRLAAVAHRVRTLESGHLSDGGWKS